MTKILALDSSTDACSAALLSDGKITSRFEMAIQSHTQRLLPMVDELLREQACELESLDAIAFGRGPGSFTGLRICMGIVQGLAFGTNLPVIPISTLRAMAHSYQLNHPQNSTSILCCLDARMNEVYAGFFSANRLPMDLMDEAVLAPQNLSERIKNLKPSDKIIGLGSGWNYTELNQLDCAFTQINTYPQASSIALLAEESWLKSEAISVMDAQPVYLRDSVSWQKRQRIRN